jgi:hypothetical protein
MQKPKANLNLRKSKVVHTGIAPEYQCVPGKHAIAKGKAVVVEQSDDE